MPPWTPLALEDKGAMIRELPWSTVKSIKPSKDWSVGDTADHNPNHYIGSFGNVVLNNIVCIFWKYVGVKNYVKIYLMLFKH